MLYIDLTLKAVNSKNSRNDLKRSEKIIINSEFICFTFLLTFGGFERIDAARLESYSLLNLF